MTFHAPAHAPIKTPVRTALMCTAAALALGLGACRDKGDAAGATSDAVAAISIEGLSDRDVAARFRVKAREVETASAEAALAEIELLEESDTVTWDSRTGDNGNYTYRGLRMVNTEDASVVTVDRLDLLGARMEGGTSRFDKIVAADTRVVVSEPDEELEMGLASLTLINPRVEDANFIADAGENTELPAADAVALEGFSLSGRDDEADLDVGLDALAYAAQSAPGARDGFFTLEDATVAGEMYESGNTTPIDMSLSSVTVTGLTSAEEMSAVGSGGMGSLGMGLNNPYALPFAQFELDDLAIDVDGVDIDLGGVRMVSKESGDTIRVRSVMDPLTVAFAGESASPQIAQAREMMSNLGFETLEFTAASESVLDKKADTAVSRDGHFTMTDGFRMEIDQDMRGLAAMQAAQAEALSEMGFETAPGPDASDAEREAYTQAVLQSSMAGVSELEIGEFVMRMDDNGIMDAMFAFAAQQDGSTAKQKRMQAKSFLAMAGMFSGGSGVDPDIVNNAAIAVGEWIDSPGSTLVLGFDPADYVPVMDLQGLDADTMGFVARVDE